MRLSSTSADTGAGSAPSLAGSGTSPRSLGGPGTGAAPVAPSFVDLVNAFASSSRSDGRMHARDVNPQSASPISRSPAYPAQGPARDRDASLPSVALPREAATGTGGRGQAVVPPPAMSSSATSSGHALPPSSAEMSSPLEGPHVTIAPASVAPSQKGAPAWRLIAAAFETGDIDGVTAELPPSPRRPPDALTVGRHGAAAVLGRAPRKDVSAPPPGAAAADERLVDALGRGPAIHARVAADGAWHARFRSAEHGPVAVRIARERDGTLTVTVRAARQALAGLDGDALSAAIGRPVRLVHDPLDTPPPAASGATR